MNNIHIRNEGLDMFKIQRNIAAGFAALVLLAVTSAYAADSAEAIKQRVGSGNPVAGADKSMLCQGCHGEDGNSIEALIPKLSGQYAVYITKQLRNFQTGARKHQIMSAMAATINDADLADIGAYFASLKKMEGNGSGDNPLAKNLFTKGDSVRGIPPCNSCHGANGKGQAPNIATFPVIGGQQNAYLRGQLINWRSGERANSPDGIMNKVAKTLSDSEIDALADYISGL